MNIGMLLDMATDGLSDRVALGSRAGGMTFAELGERTRRVATKLAACDGARIGFIDVNSDAVPLTLLGAALAGKPFAPINYRLADSQLVAILRRMAPATVVVCVGVAERLGPIEGITLLDREELLDVAGDPSTPLFSGNAVNPDEIAVLLFTSGTSGEPKAAVLRHRNLTSYILSSVEFAEAGENDAALVGVPPYHIAGVSAVLSNLYAGRRTLRLESFDPLQWVDLARREQVTHAMVVPTMLTRILDVLEREQVGLPMLRTLSYGGGPMPLAVIERALGQLPGVGFVNAYGLTETSSTISVLGPEDHREALAAADPAVRARLGSVGRPLPALRVSIRGAMGEELPDGERGEIWVSGEQVSGEYLNRQVAKARLDELSSGSDDGAWFHTRDAGMLDEAGYLFVYGRLDDVIVRGGENLSPGEIEAVLLEHPDVAEAAAFGVPDVEWGEKVVAAVVLNSSATADSEELRAHVRARLRSISTPEHIQLREALPYTETGKLLRRVLRAELTEVLSEPAAPRH
jgi:fatty-acyl-CoA synthase